MSNPEECRSGAFLGRCPKNAWRFGEPRQRSGKDLSDSLERVCFVPGLCPLDQILGMPVDASSRSCSNGEGPTRAIKQVVPESIFPPVFYERFSHLQD